MDRAREALDDVRNGFAGGEARDSEQHYRDLGLLAYLTATGRPIDEADRQRVINRLWAIEQSGKMPAFRLVTSAPPPPPPPPPAPQAQPHPATAHAEPGPPLTTPEDAAHEPAPPAATTSHPDPGALSTPPEDALPQPAPSDEPR